VVEYRRSLRHSEERLWGTKNRIALDWAGGQEFTGGPGENGSSLSANDRNESGQANDEGDSRLGLVEGSRDVGWERVYRGKRSECVVGSLAQGTHIRR